MAVSGLSGGCFVAAYAYVRGRPMTAYVHAALDERDETDTNNIYRPI